MSDIVILHQLNLPNDRAWLMTGTTPGWLVPTWFEATMPFLFEDGLKREYKSGSG